MAKAHLYRMKNIRTGEYLPKVYKAAEVVEIVGKKFEVSNYARYRTAIDSKWLIEFADGFDGYIDPNEGWNDGWEVLWKKEWDKARMKLLKAGGKA